VGVVNELHTPSTILLQTSSSSSEANPPQVHKVGISSPSNVKRLIQPRRGVRQIPPRTCAASIALLVVGLVLCGLAIWFFVENPEHEGALPMLLLAILGERQDNDLFPILSYT